MMQMPMHELPASLRAGFREACDEEGLRRCPMLYLALRRALLDGSFDLPLTRLSSAVFLDLGREACRVAAALECARQASEGRQRAELAAGVTWWRRVLDAIAGEAKRRAACEWASTWN